MRKAMQREAIDELPIYPEQRQCARPTTEQVLRLFSMTTRHRLVQNGVIVQVFDNHFTDLQLQVLSLLGVNSGTFQKINL